MSISDIKGSTYTIRHNDCLWNIVKNRYGLEEGKDNAIIWEKIKEIQDNNRFITDPALIYPEQVLTFKDETINTNAVSSNTKSTDGTTTTTDNNATIKDNNPKAAKQQQNTTTKHKDSKITKDKKSVNWGKSITKGIGNFFNHIIGYEKGKDGKWGINGAKLGMNALFIAGGTALAVIGGTAGAALVAGAGLYFAGSALINSIKNYKNAKTNISKEKAIEEGTEASIGTALAVAGAFSVVKGWATEGFKAPTLNPFKGKGVQVEKSTVEEPKIEGPEGKFDGKNSTSKNNLNNPVSEGSEITADKNYIQNVKYTPKSGKPQMFSYEYENGELARIRYDNGHIVNKGTPEFKTLIGKLSPKRTQVTESKTIIQKQPIKMPQILNKNDRPFDNIAIEAERGMNHILNKTTVGDKYTAEDLIGHELSQNELQTLSQQEIPSRLYTGTPDRISPQR